MDIASDGQIIAASHIPGPGEISRIPDPQPAQFAAWRPASALCLGIAVTLCVYGYQFGHSNDTVYLTEAIRLSDPNLLAQDWFTTRTFQYHVIFSHLGAILMHLGIIQPAFAAMYVGLVVAFHMAWRGIVRHLGGTDAAYLLSVALYYLSAAGTGLGMYQFFQDSALLPGNIANVALLCGLWLWLIGRIGWSGVCFAVAAIFHLNHAVIGSAIWIWLCAPKVIRNPIKRNLPLLLPLLPAMLNIGLAAHLKLARSGAMPLDQFINLYVRLRHPHHYDPSTWPIGIWIAFVWPIVAGAILLRGQARRIFVFFLLVIIPALIGAGIWYVSETLVQMSLYRFSIYPQIVGCMAAGVWIDSILPRRRSGMVLGVAACVGLISISVWRGPFFGFFKMPGDDPKYIAFCRWVRQNTPADAVFLVPPDEESMRLIGQRAIVINYKSVPQLSAELLEWRQRLIEVLSIEDLNALPHGYVQTLAAIHRRYNELTLDQHIAAARRYGARYIVYTDASGQFMLYDLQR